jgi:predicted hydrolase (HD superfamily)
MSLQLHKTSFGNAADKRNALSKEDADQLFHEWVLNPRLQLHMKQVAYLMRCWAKEKEDLNEQGQWRWEIAGLLHDADWISGLIYIAKKSLKNLKHVVLILKLFMLLPHMVLHILV